MKIAVVGGGPTGSKLTTWLGQRGHEAATVSLDTGADILTGEGLGPALAGADVVVDVSNPPPADPVVAREFFETSTGQLLNAGATAGVGHHVVLSAVGLDQLRRSGYFQAKTAQEKLIEYSAIPHSIVRATQFFEYLPRVADAATEDGVARFAPALFQPVAEDDVIEALGRISTESPLIGTIEVAGPEQFRMDEFFLRALATRGDPRTVVTDPHATFFGIELGERALLPGHDAVLGRTRYRDWPGQTLAGDRAFLDELEVDVRTELIQAEISPAEEEAISTPVDEWLSDPADDQRYEARLRSLLGAVDALQNGSQHKAEGR